MDDAPLPLQLFTLRDGMIVSAAGQDAVDHYAADFQGLRHFGSKIGQALDLGDPWTGTLQEDEFTLNFAYFDAGTSSVDPGGGALVGEAIPLFELLNRVSTQEA
ncbi:MAG: hypothetical protein HS117_14250 [Verrucomicrobiaceae bacterium]|nr:hypothetical protein [Verrucomicrobiaceae bacterium]